MKTDVSLTYEKVRLFVQSEVVGYCECRPSLIVLSRGPDGIEVPEAIGEPLDIEMRKALWERDKGSRTYRCFDPLDVGRFHLVAAGMVAYHLCHVMHRNIKPKRGMGRAFCRLDRFLLKLKIPYYSRVPLEKRELFERYLRDTIRGVEISE